VTGRAQRTGKIVRGMRVDVADEDDVPGFGKLLRDSRADTRATAGDERDARMSEGRRGTAGSFSIQIHSELSNDRKQREKIGLKRA
jgi:hypothetical protein